MQQVCHDARTCHHNGCDSLCTMCNNTLGLSSFVHCMQVHAAGWCGRSNANAGWLPAAVNNYAEGVICVSLGDKQLHTYEGARCRCLSTYSFKLYLDISFSDICVLEIAILGSAARSS